MSNYRITYLDDNDSTRTIDLLPGNDGVQVDWRTELNRNTSSTGIYETVVQNTLRFVSFDCYFQEAVFHQLESFMSFAQQGKPFTFSKDATKGMDTVSTPVTLGASSLNVTTGVPGIEIGDYIMIATTDGTKWEVPAVTNAVGSEVFFSPTAQHAYPVGSIVSWYYYFDQLLLLDDKFNPDRDGSYWHHTFNCVEVRNAT